MDIKYFKIKTTTPKNISFKVINTIVEASSKERALMVFGEHFGTALSVEIIEVINVRGKFMEKGE